MTELHTHGMNLYWLYHKVYFMNPHCIKSKRVKRLLCDVILAKSILKAQVESISKNYEDLKMLFRIGLELQTSQWSSLCNHCHWSSAAILGNFHKMFFTCIFCWPSQSRGRGVWSSPPGSYFEAGMGWVTRKEQLQWLFDKKAWFRVAHWIPCRICSCHSLHRYGRQYIFAASAHTSSW